MSLFDERRYLLPFNAQKLPQQVTDVLVVGGGVAGLRAAIAADDAGAEVLLLTKDTIVESNTWYAQGGIAAVLDNEGDSPEAHAADTLAVGAGLCDEDAVKFVVEQGPKRVLELLKWGANFDKDDAGELMMSLEGGHSFARIIHAFGDATGRELSNVQIRTVKSRDGIRVLEGAFVVDVLTDNSGRCVGVLALLDGKLTAIWARRTILSTGGAGMLFRETSNPSIATADGHAAAWRAGAVLQDVEMMQFHPTTLYVAGAARSLITEAVRGAGAHLIDRNGHRFMPGVHPDAELAPRDVVARGIIDQIRDTNFTHVYLDVRHLEWPAFGERFPGLIKLCENFDIDPKTDPIPVHPSAHYMIGGLATDLTGRTNVEALYAAGECACTGLHGANRLASNSLLEGLAFGERCGREAGILAASDKLRFPIKLRHDVPPSERTELDVTDVRSSLRSVMWRNACIERTADRLDETAEIIGFWGRYVMDKVFTEVEGLKLQNMLTVARLMVKAAAERTESRGVHYRTDFPDRNDKAWRVRIQHQRTEAPKHAQVS
ncbi:MAG: L-aspartate oxidase [Planctomycetota bacterium]